MGQPTRAEPGLLPEGLPGAGPRFARTVRPLVQPGMVHAQMVGHEVQEQPEAVRWRASRNSARPASPPRASATWYPAMANGEPPTSSSRQPGQDLVVKPPLVRRPGQRLAAGRTVRPPHTHQPQMRKAQPAPALELVRRHAGKRYSPAALLRPACATSTAR